MPLLRPIYFNCKFVSKRIIVCMIFVLGAFTVVEAQNNLKDSLT
ncbi:MAG: hypothetical protein ACI9AV_001742, partial [Sediminicola sp.]